MKWNPFIWPSRPNLACPLMGHTWAHTPAIPRTRSSSDVFACAPGKDRCNGDMVGAPCVSAESSCTLLFPLVIFKNPNKDKDIDKNSYGDAALNNRDAWINTWCSHVHLKPGLQEAGPRSKKSKLELSPRPLSGSEWSQNDIYHRSLGSILPPVTLHHSLKGRWGYRRGLVCQRLWKLTTFCKRHLLFSVGDQFMLPLMVKTILDIGFLG